MQIDFDPTVISYEDLLEVFWEAHNPIYGGAYGQYRSMILYNNDDQRKMAEASKDELEEKRGAVFSTTVKQLKNFATAEFYHQKFYLQADSELMRLILSRYPNRTSIVDSTAAARLNGYIAGYGTAESLMGEIEDYGLTEEGINYLLGKVQNRGPSFF